MKLILLAIVFVVGVYFFSRAKSPAKNSNVGGGGGSVDENQPGAGGRNEELRNEEIK